MSKPSSAAAWHPAGALPLLLLIGPYYLNKLIYIAFPGYGVFLATDYLGRLFTLAALYLVLRRAPVRFALPWRLTWPTTTDLVLILGGAVALIALDLLTQPAVDWLNDLSLRLTRYPEPTSPVAMIVDDSLGNLLIGFSEEAIFRFYLINALLLRGSSRGGAVMLSTVVFAAIHWSFGLGAVAFAAGAGLLLATTYLTTRSLTAPVLIHALYDAADFTGLIAALHRWLFG
jgi:membrane protease YdiL (CAAX protease family)